ncbi:MAG: CGNR zinc finger domain-containing protein [Candidatus Eisenbacteria bacterium]|nr:CGNR zinc finger domain-containing protein [Candidatus Eisenbacteria bacterium]
MNLQIVAHLFQPHDLVGGHVAVDLINTVTARDSQPVDWLVDYPALVGWATLTAQFGSADLDRLRKLAHRAPRAARAALLRSTALREALGAILAAIVEEATPPAVDLATLDQARRAAGRAAALRAFAGEVRVAWSVERSGLDLITHVVADAAVRLLESLPSHRLRRCDGRDCGWLFLDTSKNGRRRWCDMATCGNSAKARRHLAKLSARSRRPPPRP